MAAPKPPSPPEQLRAFAAALQKGLPRAVVVRGEERFFRDEAVRLASDAAAKAGLEVVRHDARDPDLDVRGLVDDLTAAPMFAAARCVVVRGAAALLKKEEGEEPPFLRAALAFLSGQSPPGVLVLDAEGLRADSAVVKKAVAAGAPVLEMRKLYDQPPPWERGGDLRRTELVLWLQARARERGVALSPDEALYVATAVGNDLAALDGAITRLEGRGRESVKSLVAWESGSSPWDVAEQILRGDVARAAAGIEMLLRTGFTGRDGEREVDRPALLAMLFGSLRGKAREALAGARAEARGEDALKAIEYKGPPMGRDEVLIRVRCRDAEQWERLIEDLAALERSTRTGRDGDASELLAFALRWKVQRRPAGR